MAWRAPSTRTRDPTRECFICVASASSNSTDRSQHHATDAQRRVRLDELAEARRQLNEELSNLHRELREDPKPHNRQPTPLPVVQEQCREGNGERQGYRPAAKQPRAHALTPSA
jgi:hypothetical protein